MILGLLVAMALPIWLVRRGHDRMRVALGLLAATLLPIPLFLRVPGSFTAV